MDKETEQVELPHIAARHSKWDSHQKNLVVKKKKKEV